MQRPSTQSIIAPILVCGLFSLTVASPAEAGLGKLWPFSTKKHVKKQVDPLTGRVGELEEVSKQHEVMIKEMDTRLQAGVEAAMSKAQEADAKTNAADQKATKAESLARLAHNEIDHLESNVEERLTNLDDYQPVESLSVSFGINQVTLNAEAKKVVDRLAEGLSGDRGYLVQVQGFSDSSGSARANLELSRRRANSVVRYLAERHAIPLFRIRTMGMGAVEGEGRRVHLQLLRNESSAQVASATN